VDDTPVCGIDFLPTFCQATGVKPPPTDGVSTLDLITKRQPLAPRDLYWHYPHYSNQLGKPGGAIRQGDFKLVEMYEDGSLELYNLKNDVGERSNLVAAMPAKARELHTRLVTWRKAIPNLQMPQPNPKYDPQKADIGYWWQISDRPGGNSK